MITTILILLYIGHIFWCRYLYIKIINTDKDFEAPLVAISWFLPFVGLLIHLLMYSSVKIDQLPDEPTFKGNWFIPKSKKDVEK